MRVLVAEDYVTLAGRIAQGLAQAGMAVDAVYDGAAALEAAIISGDPVLAERLIANLVDNAVRYNIAAGDIWISTRPPRAAAS